jgi:hypothetical protein
MALVTCVTRSSQSAALSRFNFIADDPERCRVVQFHHPLLFPQDVERPVSTHREEPCLQAARNLVPILLVEPDEGILNNIPGPFEVMDDPHGVSDQRALELCECLLYEFIASIDHIFLFRPHRGSFYTRNGWRHPFLGEFTPPPARMCPAHSPTVAGAYWIEIARRGGGYLVREILYKLPLMAAKPGDMDPGIDEQAAS